MTLGFDAKWYYAGPASGRAVIRALTNALIRTRDGDQLALFFDANHEDQALAEFGGTAATLHFLWNGMTMLANTLLLGRSCRKANVDVLVSQNFIPLRGPFRRLAFIHDAIYLDHPEFFSRRERAYFSLIRPISRRGDGIITVSEAERRRLARLHFRSMDEIFVVPNAVEPRFQPRARFAPDAIAQVRARYALPETYVLYVGRLNARKNLRKVLEAFSRASLATTRLVVVGGGDWMKVDVLRIAASLGIAERVLQVGNVPDADLSVLYACASAFCFVSLDEGFGLPPLEALASGVPAVVSDIPSHREVCGDAALYVDPHDADGIAAALVEVLAAPRLRDELISKGLARSRRTSWDASAKRLWEIARHVADERRMEILSNKSYL